MQIRPSRVFSAAGNTLSIHTKMCLITGVAAVAGVGALAPSSAAAQISGGGERPAAREPATGPVTRPVHEMGQRSPHTLASTIKDVVILDALFGGGGGGGGTTPGTDRSCVQTISHSSFSEYQNPVGQTVILQAGFAQGEWLAQTYTVPAADFPLKITTMETIFATSSSTTSTTTRWSVAIWQGAPSSGQPVAIYSSDGDEIQHLILPPGDAAGLIRFGIDPLHPEQIIVQNDGTNTFTLGFRIDGHHSPSGNPCTTSPGTCCNAFPVVDLDGVASQTGNWIFSIDCGPFGCIPNGGWARFSELFTLCRPTGDWIMRAHWQPLSCTPGIGACCLPNGTCNVTSATLCQSQGGIYQGDGVDCAAAECPVPTGACCFANGNCLNLTDANCITASGTWLGGGTQCSSGACPTGACCMPDGQCAGALTSPACTAQNGVFQGVGSVCSGPGGVNCPQPTGACCAASGGCLVLTAHDCDLIPGTSWAGAFTACTVGRCCYANCDASTVQPILNVDDFTCFINKFADAQGLPHEQQITHYANCDASTSAPVINVDDFTCFINKFAAGCP